MARRVGDGRCKHPLLGTWHMMIARCHNPRHKNFGHYGARGISVCERWRNDFWAFIADVGDRPLGMTLDRVDNDGDYEPGNVRWADRSTQKLNQRPRPPVTHCKYGHVFDEVNTYWRPDGKRACKTCQRARDREHHNRKKASA